LDEAVIICSRATGKILRQAPSQNPSRGQMSVK
jgi:hypothetical protein